MHINDYIDMFGSEDKVNHQMKTAQAPTNKRELFVQKQTTPHNRQNNGINDEKEYTANDIHELKETCTGKKMIVQW